MDWSGCPIVVSRPEYVSGAPALRDDPRVSVESIVVNMDDNLMSGEVAVLFNLRTPLADIQAVYDYARRQRALTPV